MIYELFKEYIFNFHLFVNTQPSFIDFYFNSIVVTDDTFNHFSLLTDMNSIFYAFVFQII